MRTICCRRSLPIIAVYYSSQGIQIRRCSTKVQSDRPTRRSSVPEKPCLSSVGSKQHVQIPVCVNIPHSQAAAYKGLIEGTTCLFRNVYQLSCSIVPEQLRILHVLNISLDTVDLRLDMPIGQNQILVTIQVVVEKIAIRKSGSARSAGPGGSYLPRP